MPAKLGGGLETSFASNENVCGTKTAGPANVSI